jgi:hypothetical protein
MGLGIRPENNIYTVFSIPLEWEKNGIIADHLRFLADAIEQEWIRILNIRLSAPINQPYSKPCLEIIAFKR